MRGKMKRLMAFIVSLSMVFSLFVVPASAAIDVDHSTTLTISNVDDVPDDFTVGSTWTVETSKSATLSVAPNDYVEIDGMTVTGIKADEEAVEVQISATATDDGASVATVKLVVNPVPEEEVVASEIDLKFVSQETTSKVFDLSPATYTMGTDKTVVTEDVVAVNFYVQPEDGEDSDYVYEYVWSSGSEDISIATNNSNSAKAYITLLEGATAGKHEITCVATVTEDDVEVATGEITGTLIVEEGPISWTEMVAIQFVAVSSAVDTSVYTSTPIEYQLNSAQYAITTDQTYVVRAEATNYGGTTYSYDFEWSSDSEDSVTVEEKSDGDKGSNATITLLKGTMAGVYTITCVGTAFDADFNEVGSQRITTTVTVLDAEVVPPTGVTLTVEDAEYTYDGTAHVVTLISDVEDFEPVMGENVVVFYQQDGQDIAIDDEGVVNAGTYDIYYEIDSYKYTGEGLIEDAMTIDKAEVTPTVTIPATFVYGTTLATTDVVVTDEAYGFEASEITYYDKIDDDYSEGTIVAPTAVGEYTARIVLAESDNYTPSISEVITNFEITPATITVSAVDVTTYYGNDGIDDLLKVEYSGFQYDDGEEVFNAPDPVATTEVTDESEIGEYVDAVTPVEEYTADNYTFEYVPATITIAEVQQDSIKFTTSDDTMNVTQSMKVSAEVDGENGVDLYWFSSNPEVADFDDDGYLVAYKEGQTAIVAYDEETGEEAWYTMNVSEEYISLEFSNLSQVYDGTVKEVTLTSKSSKVTFEELDVEVLYYAVVDGVVSEEASDAIAVGEYFVTYEILGDTYEGYGSATMYIIENSLEGTSGLTVKVGSSSYRDGVLNAGSGTFVYGADTTVTSQIPSGFTKLGYEEGSITYTTDDGNAPTNVGTYTVTVEFVSPNYATVTKTATYKITPATLTATPEAKEIEFNEAAGDLVVNVTGFKYEETVATAAGYTAPVAAVLGYDAGLNVGTYTITVSGGSADNYTFAYETAELTVGATDANEMTLGNTQATSATGKTWDLQAYIDGNEVTSVVTWKSSSPDVATVGETTGTVVTVANGKTTITATYSGGEGYSYNAAQASFGLEVIQSDTILNFDDLTHTYDSGVKAVTLSNASEVSAFDPVIGTNVDVLYYEQITEDTYSEEGVESVSNAGTYKVVYTIDDVSYNGTGVNYMTILPATADEGEFDFAVNVTNSVYGAFVEATADEVEGWEEVVSYKEVAAPTNVGKYTAVATYSKANYNDYDEEAEFDITPAPLTITADDKEMDFGGSVPALTASYGVEDEDGEIINGLVNGDLASVVIMELYTEANSNSKVDTYDITVVADPTATNYDITFVKGTLTISKAPAGVFNVTSTATTFNVGDKFTLTAFIEGDMTTDVLWTIEITDTVSYDSITGQYTVLKSGDIEITAEYTGTNYTADDFTFKATVGKTNLDLVFDQDSLEQTYEAGVAKVVTLTTGSTGVNYAELDNVEVTYTNLTTNVVSEAIEVGRYDVTYVINDDVYEGTGSATMEIVKASATDTFGVTGVDAAYGQAAAATAVDLTASGWTATISYEDASGSPMTEMPVDAGKYTAVATYTHANYATEIVKDDFIISQVVVTVTAPNKTIDYNDEIGDLGTETYVGFVNGEDESVLISEVKLSTVAEKGSVPTTYPIVASGATAANYTFTYVDGILTITTQDLTGSTLVIVGAQTDVKVGKEFIVSAEINNDDVTVDWESGNTSIATVDAYGNVKAVAEGTTEIKATLNDPRYSGTLTASFTLYVNQNNVILTPQETTVTYDGYAHQITFTSTTQGFTVVQNDIEVKYYDSANNYLGDSVRDAGKYTAYYVLNDGTHYNSGSVVVTIDKAEVTVYPNDYSTTYGDDLPNYTIAPDADMADAINSALLGEDRYVSPDAGDADTYYDNVADYAATAIFETQEAGANNYYDMYADMFVLSTAVDADGKYADAGTYPILIEFAEGHDADSSNNYTFTLGSDGTLTINPKDLTFTADNMMVEDGTTNADMRAQATYTVDGFVLDQDEQVLTLASSGISFGITDGSKEIDDMTDPGFYDAAITMGGYGNNASVNGNYRIYYVAGDLTIVDNLVVTAAGVATTGYLEVRMDQEVDLAGVVFTVTEKSTGNEIQVTAVENEPETEDATIFADEMVSYYLEGTFTLGETYTVTLADNTTVGNWPVYDYGFVPSELVYLIVTDEIAVTGTGTTSALTVKFDEPVADATFTVDGVEAVATASADNKTYTISGTFTASTTYAVEITSDAPTGFVFDKTAVDITVPAAATGGSSGGSSGGGGGGGTTTYSISTDAENGTIDASKSSSAKDKEITFTVTPDDGYELVGITVVENDDDAEAIDFEYDDEEGAYVFTMPSSKVLITATFTAVFENETPFTDVDVDDANYAGIAYVYANGIMAGISETEFGGEMSITRGMITAILYRLNGSVPADESVEMPFTDVAETAYYYEAVRWAKEVGVVAGYDEDTFAPDQTISNEQFAALMYRYATFKGMATAVDAGSNLDGYKDADEITAYAYAALLWACEYGVMGDASKLYPTDYAIREEVATSLMNFMEMGAAVETEEVEAEEEVVEEVVEEEEI
ncbi:MBG domain-containing protein [Chakrabartyella piscis]|uniref:MBG domain-containing protein n=1 Tax=Chakrabartyella piscis TaxID=2918914 RepID=UPI0029584FE4|nr:MBG domain-containing protein [Chakrabartyella piscis]